MYVAHFTLWPRVHHPMLISDTNWFISSGYMLNISADIIGTRKVVQWKWKYSGQQHYEATAPSSGFHDYFISGFQFQDCLIEMVIVNTKLKTIIIMSSNEGNLILI